VALREQAALAKNALAALVGKANTEFDAELTRLNIRHGYTVVPGTHSMFVWRPALAKFLQQIFRR